MEEIKILQGEEAFNKLKAAQEKSIDIQRYLVYQQKLEHAFVLQKKETDTHIYWAYSEYKPMFNKKLIMIRKPISGYTYDKQKQTIKAWFGGTPQKFSIVVKHILDHFNIEWYNAFYMGSFYETVTNSLLQRMIRGKITNPRDYAKAILKGKKNLRDTGLTAEYLYKKLCSTDHMSIQSFIYMCPAFKNPNRLVELAIEGGLHWTIADMTKQARILDKKIDLNWSKKRMQEEHNNWTREIMRYELDSIEEINFNYPHLDLPEGLEIIKTNRELFEEGSTMKHCLYTNYQHNVKNKTYFAFRYDLDGVRATLGVSYYDRIATFSQMFGIGNSAIDDKIKDRIKEWIATEYMQNWFNKVGFTADRPAESIYEAEVQFI